jgi:hypothetical protein
MKVIIKEKKFFNRIGTLIFSFNNSKNQVVMAITQTILQKSKVTVTTVDRKGNPKAVEAGSFKATSSNPLVASVGEVSTADDINFDIEVISEGLGTAQLDVIADADLGDGIVTISGFAAIEVLPEMAAGFGGFTQSEVVDK